MAIRGKDTSVVASVKKVPDKVRFFKYFQSFVLSPDLMFLTDKEIFTYTHMTLIHIFQLIEILFPKNGI